MATKSYSAPNVYREEIDKSDVLVPEGISVGAVVTYTTKGPINRPVVVTSETEYVETFGTPVYTSGCSLTTTDGVQTYDKYLVPDGGYGAYAAIEFLKVSNALYVIRSATSADKFSSVSVTAVDGPASSATTVSGWATTSGISVDDTQSSFDTRDRIQSLDKGFGTINAGLKIGAVSPGLFGNNVAVTIESFSLSADWFYKYDNFVSAVKAYTTTGTSASALTDYPTAASVFKLNVYLKGDGTAFSGYQTSAGSDFYALTPVETFYGTLDRTKTDSNGDGLYIEDVVNGKSKYIYTKASGTGKFDNIKSSAYLPVIKDSVFGYVVRKSKLVALDGGVYNLSGDISTAPAFLSNLKNREAIPNLGIVICPSWKASVKQAFADVAMSRKDCVCTVQSEAISYNSVDEILDPFTGETYGYSTPSYVNLYENFGKVYDKYNRKYVYLPMSIFGAVLMARTDSVANPWDAPAGISRGILPVLEVKTVRSIDDIGRLYDANINGPRVINGVGSVMWGQKTAQMKDTALNRINVRRNVLFIENNMEKILQAYLFQNNTEKERQRIFFTGNEFLNSVKIAGGLYDYQIIVDTTNNTPDVIDANQLIVDIGLQPVKAMEFILLRTTITRTGVTITEV